MRLAPMLGSFRIPGHSPDVLESLLTDQARLPEVAYSQIVDYTVTPRHRVGVHVSEFQSCLKQQTNKPGLLPAITWIDFLRTTQPKTGNQLWEWCR